MLCTAYKPGIFAVPTITECFPRFTNPFTAIKRTVVYSPTDGRGVCCQMKISNHGGCYRNGNNIVRDGQRNSFANPLQDGPHKYLLHFRVPFFSYLPVNSPESMAVI